MISQHMSAFRDYTDTCENSDKLYSH